MDTIIIVPARLESTRLEHKLIQKIGEKRLIEHCVNAITAQSDLALALATDCKRLSTICRTFCPATFITPEFPNGTERVAYLLSQPMFKRFTHVIIIQGDELIIPDGIIHEIHEKLQSHDIVTVCKDLQNPLQIEDYNCVKVSECDTMVHDMCRKVDDMSTNWYEHVGIYGYRIRTLFQLSRGELTTKQKERNIELMKAIELGYEVALVKTEGDCFNVNTPEDLERARSMYG